MEVDEVCSNMVRYERPRKSAMSFNLPDTSTAKHHVVLAQKRERWTSTDEAVSVLVFIGVVERPRLILLDRQQRDMPWL